MCACNQKIRISIGLADECVIPSGVLRGEVIVVVDPSCTEGVRYHRIRLELTGREHNAVRDDQGEFDALLDGYTSDRIYLSRHVTLSGRKKASEDLETALQRKQEVMFRQHHTAPYSRVIPVKPKEPTVRGGSNSGAKKGAAAGTTAQTPAGVQAAPAESGADPSAVHDVGDVEMTRWTDKRQRTKPSQRQPNADEDEDMENVEVDREGNSSDDDDAGGNVVEGEGRGDAYHPHDYGPRHKQDSTGSSSKEKRGHCDSAAPQGNSSDSNALGHTDILASKSPDPNASSGNTPSSSGAAGKEKQLTQHASSSPSASGHPSPRVVVQPPTAAALERLEAQEERPVDETKAQRRRPKDVRLMPGRYTFPFSFRVPPWLPPSLYYSIADASGSISYSAKATVDFGPGKRDLVSRKRFYVLSAISRRQLIACHEEAINAATTNPLPPLSALFQVFACNCLGNMCCLASHSAVEVEVALQCSRALVLADANATYHVFREYQNSRQEPLEGSGEKGADGASKGAPTAGGNLAGAFNGYDAFMERKYLAPEEDFISPAAFVDKFLKAQQEHEKDDGLTTTPTSASGTESDRNKSAEGSGGDGPHRASRSARLAAYREAKKEAMRERRAEVEKALPLPIGVLPLLVRVHNGCSKREISKVRVELRETIQVFKSLEMPRVFKHPLARYDYTVSIPPGDEVTFAARLQLPKQFRRRKDDDAKLCPPPGVKTANIATSTEIVVSFPGLATYVEEEDWVNSVVQLAEAVDMSDEVLDLPVRYS